MTIMYKTLISSAVCNKQALQGRLKLVQLAQNKMMSGTNVNLNPDTNKIFEFRTYGIYPHKMPEFLAITKTNFGPRVVHSKPLGYWTTELGGLNQVVHIWPYDSVAHRAKVRGDLGKSTEWHEKYISKALPMFQYQENSVLQALTEVPINILKKDCSLYELHFYRMKTNEKEWALPLNELLEATIANPNSSTEDSSLVMAFKTICGTTNGITVLWQHPTMESFHNHERALGSSLEYKNLVDHTKKVTTKVLSPFIISHWM